MACAAALFGWAAGLEFSWAAADWLEFGFLLAAPTDFQADVAPFYFQAAGWGAASDEPPFADAELK